ncbi:hypothetical protein [Piscirickettsia litoralis]|uniref:Uncharacterized protein n=1 Tax=Piscirickettsia litoralis TaxID=1891921 RepID=A0ABX2ZXV9_9GAMM|nr:hypothetical protein [Piscirickettsia litoralis]ODN41214.1 hypothetical protein BGC07_17525 [Piscirickettsia litoralis]
MPGVEIESIDALDERGKNVIRAVDNYLDGFNQDISSISINLSDHHKITKTLGLEPCTEISRQGVVLVGVCDEA